MLRSIALAILLISPLAGNAQAMNWFSALISSASGERHTAGPALVPTSQPQLAGSHTYSEVEPMPASYSYGHGRHGHRAHGYGGHDCSSCGSNFADLWAGYCSEKRGHWFGGHHGKCCGHKFHGHKCGGANCCKSKCHSCWGHLSHWFHKHSGCSSCSSCGNHEAEHYEGEIVPTPMEAPSPSDRPAASKSASLNLLPPAKRLWPISFGL